MYQIQVSAEYIAYLEHLKDYLLNNFGKDVKNQVIKAEQAKFENLKHFPYMGKDANSLSKFLQGYWVIIDKHEYLFYQVDEDKMIISVELAFNAKEDVIKKLHKHFN
ncbi:MAG: type II toxin-antitoxin system RelE/ParE family toxin [Lactobacillus sp.]|jgi:plasmid stabilization system protein ParE|nr:type II toxin-antitoxin system RelE/ParE family toxin [Lactobacillus sp.]